MFQNPQSLLPLKKILENVRFKLISKTNSQFSNKQIYTIFLFLVFRVHLHVKSESSIYQSKKC